MNIKWISVSETLPYEHIRWIENKEEIDLAKLVGTSDMKKSQRFKRESPAAVCQCLECGHDAGQE